MSKKITKFFLIILLFLGVFFLVGPVLAQSNLDVGTAAVNDSIKLSQNNPIQTAARIINIFLGLLGLIAVGLIIFAGFQWMNSQGNEEKVSSAKMILKNAIIGLAIILSAWGIVSFILGRLLQDTGGGGGLNLNRFSGLDGGFGVMGSCTVQSVFPEPDQTDVARNTAIIVTFKEAVKLDSVCVNGAAPCACDNTATCNKINPANIKIYETEVGDSLNTNVQDVFVSVTPDNKTFIFKPVDYLGNPTSNTWYTTYLTNDILKANGDPMFGTCAADYLRWQFEVSTRLDLTPPQVRENGVFPPPDNLVDQTSTSTIAQSAYGEITLLGVPSYFQPAAVTSIAKNPPSGSWTNDVEATIDDDYEGAITQFTITILAGNKAQLFDGPNSLGVLPLGGNNDVEFPNYLYFKVNTQPTPGNSWIINVTPRVLADTINVGSDQYTFVNASSSGYNIEVSSNLITQAQKIEDALLSRTDVSPDSEVNTVVLRASSPGTNGNNIYIGANNPNHFSITPMQGGQNQTVNVTVQDRKDKPMNSVVQINFNEAVNPMSVVGDASQVKDYIRIVNYDYTAKAAGQACTTNSGCKSYKCENNLCVGNYVDGKFKISNGYKTVEFTSNVECGMNGCGGKIYCLPSSSNLKVELVAADLSSCTDDSGCSDKSPFSTCATSSLAHKTCQNQDNQNYPTVPLGTLTGITDAAFNSLNGNRNLNPDGPVSYFNENTIISQPLSTAGDSFQYSFFINSQIEANPPKITSITPSSNFASTTLDANIKIKFDKLMMSSTLQTGSTEIEVATTTVEHKLINLRSDGGPGAGYWITSENFDDLPSGTPDGESDATEAYINHSTFFEAVNYVSQVGSGVNDIYQNCFKPSVGPSCVATQNNPSCCYGTPTSNLGPTGECP